MLVVNARGRHAVVCDGCETNIIDLSPVESEAERVSRNFFGWGTAYGAEGTRHHCRDCRRPPARRGRRVSRWRIRHSRTSIEEMTT